MCECSARLYFCTVYAYLVPTGVRRWHVKLRRRQGIRSPETRDKDWLQATVWVLGIEPGLLQEQHVFFNAESPSSLVLSS